MQAYSGPALWNILENDEDSDATCVVPDFSAGSAVTAARELIENTSVFLDPDTITDEELQPLVAQMTPCRLRQVTRLRCEEDYDRVGWWTTDGDGDVEILGYYIESASAAVEIFAESIPTCSECGENGVVVGATRRSSTPTKVLKPIDEQSDGRPLYLCGECAER